MPGGQPGVFPSPPPSPYIVMQFAPINNQDGIPGPRVDISSCVVAKSTEDPNDMEFIKSKDSVTDWTFDIVIENISTEFARLNGTMVKSDGSAWKLLGEYCDHKIEYLPSIEKSTASGAP